MQWHHYLSDVALTWSFIGFWWRTETDVAKNRNWRGNQKPRLKFLTKNRNWCGRTETDVAEQKLTWRNRNLMWISKTWHGFPKPDMVFRNLTWISETWHGFLKPDVDFKKRYSRFLKTIKCWRGGQKLRWQNRNCHGWNKVLMWRIRNLTWDFKVRVVYVETA